jgi:hypothetical protein
MKLVILLSAVFVVLGAWAANLPADEENQSDVRHSSPFEKTERQKRRRHETLLAWSSVQLRSFLS